MVPEFRPVLLQDKLMLLADQDVGEKSFLAAVSATDGKIAWKASRKIESSWTTPVILEVLVKNK